MLSIKFPLSKVLKNLERVFALSFLVAMGVASGVIPGMENSSFRLTIESTAQAEDFTAQEVTNYAKAVLQIETLRQRAYQEIQQIIDKQPSNIVCNDPNSLSVLPDNAKKIATTFCQDSKKIVENSGLTVAQFNTITSSVQLNKSLERRIQDAMLQIQQQP